MKIVIDLDSDLPPLKAWLRILKIIRVRHEIEKQPDKLTAARTLDISRYQLYRWDEKAQLSKARAKKRSGLSPDEEREMARRRVFRV